MASSNVPSTTDLKFELEFIKTENIIGKATKIAEKYLEINCTK